jgi:hypothetical protein
LRRDNAESLSFEVDLGTLDALDELCRFDALLDKVIGDVGDLVAREEKLGEEGIELGGCSRSEMQILRYAEKWIRALREKSELANA